MGLLTNGLKGLESVIVIKRTGAKHDDFDMVLQRSDNQNGEFHAWRVNDKGKISPWHPSNEGIRVDVAVTHY